MQKQLSMGNPGRAILQKESRKTNPGRKTNLDEELTQGTQRREILMGESWKINFGDGTWEGSME